MAVAPLGCPGIRAGHCWFVADRALWSSLPLSLHRAQRAREFPARIQRALTGHPIGYARVSTDEQNLDLQLDAFEAAGRQRVFCDGGSGSLPISA
jgi:resolvase-like protein